ncbi:MAG: PIN domain-containing protein [Patescibacteria group bacterium]
MRYKIFLDSNQVYNDKNGRYDDPFGQSIPELKKFLDGHSLDNVKICLPELVVRERIQHKLDLIQGAVSSVNENLEALKKVGHTQKPIKKRTDYKKTLNSIVVKFLKKYDVQRVPTPDIDAKDLIERAITKKKPFNDHSAGFKDTLIYLTIVEDATEDEADVYILCTKNKADFTDEIIKEFESQTKKKLYIISDIVSVQQTLDELIPLELHLEERNNKIKNLILNHTGDLTSSVNSTREDNGRIRGYAGALSLSALYNDTVSVSSWDSPYSTRKEEIVGYNFKNVELNRIDELKDGNFRVGITLHTEIKYKKGEKGNVWQHSAYDDFSPGAIWAANSDFMGRPLNNKDFEIKVDCNPTSGYFNIVTIV